MRYYLDFPTEPIGGGNPYYCCSYCRRSVPEINRRLDGHSSWCEYRQTVEKLDENEWLKFLLSEVMESLYKNEIILTDDLKQNIFKALNKD